MGLSAGAITGIAIATCVVGYVIAWYVCYVHEWNKMREFICYHPEDIDYGGLCNPRRAFYYAREAIWKQQAWSRDGAIIKEWLLAEIGKVDVKATTEEKTMPNNCCRDRTAYAEWEERENVGKIFRRRVQDGEDIDAVRRDLNYHRV